MRRFNYDLHEINVAINDEESAAEIKKKKFRAETSLKNLKRYATVSFIDWFVRHHSTTIFVSEGKKKEDKKNDKERRCANTLVCLVSASVKWKQLLIL